MKRVQYSLLFFALVLTMACQKKVTEISPTDRLSSDLVFSTAQKMESAVIGAYNSLQGINFLSGRALLYVDLMGEDVFDKGAYFGELPRFNLLGNSTFASTLWDEAYQSIGSANRAMAGIGANPGVVSVAKAKEFTAECLFVRAISHFYLVNYFAQPYSFTATASHPGVPIITQHFTGNDPAANKPRNTVAEVYASIISDLTSALTDLPASYSSVYQTKTRATKAAAAALLSRVYLYKEDYANAKLMSQNLMNGQYGAFALRPNPDGAFGPGNYQTAESIWSIPNNANDNPNTNNALPQHYYPNGRGDLAISQTFLNVATNPYFALDDRRRGMIINGFTPSTAASFYTRKYPDVGTRADWAPVIRYAEIILNYAEATAKLGSGVDADAVAKLNIVRDRSRVSAPQYSTSSFATKDDLIKAILGERRIELAFEGHRFWDVMRNKGTITGKYDSDGVSILPSVAFGANKAIFPIPLIEIDKSKNVLIQNTGY